ncbi:MAG: ABC transporter permease [Bryobacterales bacterium]|nr:ABC transporter permease [Bryobacterales bacterium]
MRWLRIILLRWRSITRQRDLDHDLDAEFASHVEQETSDLIARGVPPSEARRLAVASLGRATAAREECRDARGVALWDEIAQDLKFSFRLFLRNRLFSAITLGTMALAIGSTSAVFGLFDAVLLRPLPFADPARLYDASSLGMRGPFDMMRANAKSADYAAHNGARAFNLAGKDWPERISGSEVSTNFFQTLGIPPALGRPFTASDHRAVILSHDLWLQRYAANPAIIGQSIALDEFPHEVVGVMPPGFSHPSPEIRLWTPLRLDPAKAGEYWGSGGVTVFARLRSGVSPAEAAAELRGWIPRIRQSFPWRMPDAWGADAALTPLRDHLVAGARLRSYLLLGVVALVLLIAVVNVANLLFGQAAARERELALRVSLGASPARLLRQMITEAVALALAAGAAGVLLAFQQLHLLKFVLPADTPRLAEAVIDLRVLAFTALISLGSGLLFGLLPAWQSHRLSRIPSAGAPLIFVESAFATILLVGAGLLLNSLWNLLAVNPGFQPDSIVTAELSPSRTLTSSALWNQLQPNLAAYPGVRVAAAANTLPLTGEFSAFTAALEDHPRPAKDPQISLWHTSISVQHLDALRIPLLTGRAFTSADSAAAAPVVLISRSTAEKFWPGANPVGRRLRPVWEPKWRTIVGVVDDVKSFTLTGLPAWAEGHVYTPLPQSVGTPPKLGLLLRVDGDPAGLLKHLPRLVNEVCSQCAVSKISQMETIVAASAQASRSLASLVAAFALLALLLSAAGIYGVVNHGVLRRSRELGIRRALGARGTHLAWAVLRPSLFYSIAGAAAGLAASVTLSRMIQPLLFGVPAVDPFSFTVAPLVLVLAAAVATLPPLVRALRIDPARTLREG